MTSVVGSTAWLLAFALLLAGCDLQGLDFRRDDRVAITAPEPREEVQLPVVVDWTVEDFEVTGPAPTSGQSRAPSASDSAGYFAVFVDGFPQPPGETLAWFVRDDQPCQASPDCPNAQYFADKGIFTTTDTEFTVEALPAGDARRDRHEVTIILLDPTGERIGESAFTIAFDVVDRGAMSRPVSPVRHRNQ